MQTVKRLHAACEHINAPYCIVGGLAVVRNGAPRTTQDIDVLIEQADWVRLCSADSSFVAEGDRAIDPETGVSVDALFPGDEWEMEIPLPPPDEIAEYDEALGGRFASLRAILESKTAVYVKKRREDGEAIAAKDLTDVVALIEYHGPRVARDLGSEMAPATASELTRIVSEVQRRKRRME